MPCEYCMKIAGEHDSRCPNYTPPKTNYYCDICKEGIYPGEEYIINDDDKYAHWECVDYGRNLAKWLGYEIKEMEEMEDEYDI